MGIREAIAPEENDNKNRTSMNNARRFKKCHLALLVVIVLVTVIAAPSVASAATYYVSTSGSDNNSGSSSSPWRTLWHAVRSINSGDTIRVQAGTYRPDSTPTIYNRDNVTLIADGHVVINGSSLPSGADCLATWEANNATIEGFELINAPRYGVSLGESDGGVVRDCVIHDNLRTGVFTWNANDALVVDNDIYANGFDPAGIHHGVYVARGCSGVVVENNLLHGNAEEGVHCNGNDYSVNSNIMIRNNIFYGNGGKAADFQNTHDSFRLNNVFYGTNTKGTGPAVISLDSDDSDANGNGGGATGSIRNTVANNTFVTQRKSRAIWLTPGSLYDNPIGAEDCVIFNNICITMSAGDAIDDDGVNNSVGNNLTLEYSSSVINDLFVDASSNDYRIREGSLAHNAGVSSYAGKTAPTTDLLGSTRVEPFDLGAYEIDEGQEAFVITTNVVGQGSVILSPDKVNYLNGDVVTLEADPSSGWAFSSWSGDKTGTSNPTTLTVTRNMSVTARFEEDASSPPVIPTSLDADENTGGCADVSWNANTESDLAGYVLYYGAQSVQQGAASAYPDSVNVGMSTFIQICNFQAGTYYFSVRAYDTSGQYSGYSTEAPLTINNPDVTRYVITTNIIGQGSVTLSPDQADYLNGDVVTLEANPSSGWNFSSWSGDKTGTSNPTTLTVTRNMSVTARFEQEASSPPVIPTSLDADENTVGCADVDWNANSEPDLAGYVVYYGTQSVQQGAASVYPDSVNVGMSTFIQICDIQAGYYYFAVRAYNSSGQYSGYSTEAPLNVTESDVTGPVITPGFPASGAVNVDPGTPYISFEVSDNRTGVNANSLSVLINGTQAASKQFIGNAMSYTVECTPASGFDANSTVTISVTADDLASPANRSTLQYSFTTGGTEPPNTPTALSVNENTPGCVDASWQSNMASDLAGFVLYYGPSSVEQGQASAYSDSVEIGLDTSIQVCDFLAGVKYFSVRAVNTSGQYSGYSSEVSLSIVGPDVTAPVISGLVPGDGATNVEPSTSKISFTLSDARAGVDDNSVSVLINGTQAATKTFSGNAASYTVECTPLAGFDANSTVTISITADDLASPANRSNRQYSFTTGSTTPPTTPWAMTINENTLGCVDAAWQSNMESDLSGFVVYYGQLSVEQGGASAYTDSVLVGMATSTQVCGFTQGTQFFAVRALNRYGQYSEYSDEKQIDIVGPDLTAPVILVGSPGEGAVNVDPRNTSIFFVISDSHSGVDTNSVEISIAGVEPSSVSFNGDPSSYAVVCEPAGGLPSNATVTIEVSAADLASPSNLASDQWSFSTTGVPPSIPMGVAANGGNDGCAYLSWDPNSEPDVNGYTVYYGTESVAFGEVSEYADSISVGMDTAMNICGLADGRYFFAVRAKSESGMVSGISAEATADVSNIDLQGPIAPQQVQVFEDTPGCVDASWEANTESNLEGYVIYYGSKSVAQGQTALYTDSLDVGTSTHREICGLTAGVYFVALRAYTTAGLYSDYSTEKLIDIVGPDTDAPALLVASPAEGASDVPQNTEVLFVLSDLHTGVDTNTVNVSIGGNAPSFMAFNGDPSRYAVVCRLSHDLPANSLINVSVTARDRAASPNQVSKNWFFTTGSLRPSSPTGLVALGDDSGTASLTWNANPENNIVGYTIYFGLASVAQGQTTSYQDSVNVGLVTDQNIGGLLDGRYYFALRAKNSNGVLSGFSSEVWADVMNAESDGPIAPQQVQPTETSPGCVTVTWGNHPDPDVAGFVVYHRPIWSVSGGESEYVDSVDVGDVNSGVVCNLDQGMYFFAVKAYNQLGQYSGFSTEKHVDVIGLDSEGPMVLVGGPLNGAVDVRPTATIFFVISDTQTGVDTNTVNVLINGEPPAKTTFTGDPTAFAVVCEPAERLPLNSLVTVQAGVSDLASSANRTQVSWNFTTSDGRPSAPTGLAAQGTDNGCARLSWNANPEEDVAGYKIYYGRDSVARGDAASYSDSITVGTITNRTICGLSDGRYFFAVRAWTDVGLMGEMSAEISTDVTNGDAQSPLPPTAVDVSETSPGCVKVEWAANSEPDIAGYIVYYGTQSVDGGDASDYGDWVEVGNALEYDVCGLTHGTYFIAVRAFNAAGGYSGYSAEYEAYIIGEDVDGPTILAGNPVDGASGVPLNSSVFFAVSDTQNGVDKNSISVTINGETPDSTSFNGNSGYYAVVCNNDDDFDADTMVNVEVTASDLSDPPNESTVSWSYTTGSGTDTTPPVTTSQSPGNGATDVDADAAITVSFRDDGEFGIALIEFFVDGVVAIDTTVTREANGDVTIVYNNTAGFTAGSTVSIQVVATDLANNSTSVEFSFSVAQASAFDGEEVAIVPNGYWAHEPTRPLEIHNLPAGWTVKIFDTSGSEVRSYKNADAEGTVWNWDFSNDHGRRVAKSLYLIRVLDTGGSVRESGRFVVQSDS